MGWTRHELDEALVEYERTLVESGRTRGTINTYVGDARRFVEWLDRESTTARSGQAPPARAWPRRVAARPTALAGAIAAPSELGDLVRRWNDAGRPAQIGIAWPRDRWIAALPQHRDLLDGLPDALDRAAVRRVAAAAGDSPSASVVAFVVTMAWGFGWVGYGPHRVARILAHPNTPERLFTAVRTLRELGATAAYARLGGDCRIQGLGPAFGTKIIAFCQPAGARPVGLIHDALVGDWLARHGRPDLVSSGWSTPVYEAYLEQVHAWADELVVPPEVIEFLMFQAMADARGNQWAAGPRSAPSRPGRTDP